MIEVELKPSKTGGHPSVSTRLIKPPGFWSYQLSWNPGIAAGGRTENLARLRACRTGLKSTDSRKKIKTKTFADKIRIPDNNPGCLLEKNTL